MNPKPLKHGSSKTFPHDAEKGYAAVVVAVTPTALVLVKSDYVGLSNILPYCTFSPTLAGDLVLSLDEGSLDAFQDFRGNAVFSWGFSSGKGIQCFVEFFQGWFALQFFQSRQVLSGIHGGFCDNRSLLCANVHDLSTGRLQRGCPVLNWTDRLLDSSVHAH